VTCKTAQALDFASPANITIYHLLCLQRYR
jgi:hypothetical protein